MISRWRRSPSRACALARTSSCIVTSPLVLALVRVTHQWVERSASRPPAAPREPIFPPRDGETEGTDFAFQWAPASILMVTPSPITTSSYRTGPI